MLFRSKFLALCNLKSRVQCEKGSFLPAAGFGLGVALKKEARGLFGGSALGTDPRKEEI